MIDVGPITLWELFKTMFMGNTVSEFNDILFKATRKKISFIQTYLNEKICIATDENYDEVTAWKENNENRKLDRKV